MVIEAGCVGLFIVLGFFALGIGSFTSEGYSIAAIDWQIWGFAAIPWAYLACKWLWKVRRAGK